MAPTGVSKTTLSLLLAPVLLKCLFPEPRANVSCRVDLSYVQLDGERQLFQRLLNCPLPSLSVITLPIQNIKVLAALLCNSHSNSTHRLFCALRPNQGKQSTKSWPSRHIQGTLHAGTLSSPGTNKHVVGSPLVHHNNNRSVTASILAPSNCCSQSAVSQTKVLNTDCVTLAENVVSGQHGANLQTRQSH